MTGFDTLPTFFSVGMYQVFSGNLAIGETALEMGDPPMGIVAGHFLPFDSFEEFRKLKTPIYGEPFMDDDQYRWDGLTVRATGGMVVPCYNGVVINAFGVLDDTLEMEITCDGISNLLYEELFPHHIEAYKNSF